ncbi:MAG TPA: glycoside hydrolase family 16 protein [Chitinophagaceae bacterium]
MTAIKPTLTLFIFIFITLISCKKNVVSTETTTEEIATGRPTAPSPTIHGVCDYDINETAILGAGWGKTFDESFSTNLNNWNTWYGGAFNNELQLYQASNLAVANGNLVISARKETVAGPTTPFDATPKTFNYTSGRIESKTNFSASSSSPIVRMMARIKLPAGYGMWPAFWSYGDPWPTQGEIDILEARGQEDMKYQTNYFYGRNANRNLVRGAEGYVTTDVSLQTCYHVYEMIWSQNELKFYFDGVLVKTNSGSYVPSLFGKTERITLNLAVGGLFFSNLNPALIQTGTMYVDWVKVFTTGN